MQEQRGGPTGHTEKKTLLHKKKDKRKRTCDGFQRNKNSICSFARHDEENKWGAVKSESRTMLTGCQRSPHSLSSPPLFLHLSLLPPPTVMTSPQKPLCQTCFPSDCCLSLCIKDGRVGRSFGKNLQSSGWLQTVEEPRLSAHITFYDFYRWFTAKVTSPVVNKFTI